MDYQRYVEMKSDDGSSLLARKKANGDYELVDRNVILLSLSIKISAMVGLLPRIITKNSLAFKPYKDDSKVVLLDISNPEKCAEFFGLVLEASKSRIGNLVFKNLTNVMAEQPNSTSYSGIVNYYEWILKQMQIITVEYQDNVNENLDRVLKMLKIGIYVALNKIDLRKPYFMVESDEKKHYEEFYKMIGVESKNYRSTDPKLKLIPKIDESLLKCIEDILESVMKKEELKFSSSDLTDDEQVIARKSLKLDHSSQDDRQLEELPDDDTGLMEDNTEPSYKDINIIVQKNIFATLSICALLGMSPNYVREDGIEINPDKCLSIPNDIVNTLQVGKITLVDTYPARDIQFFKLIALSCENLFGVNIKPLFKQQFGSITDFEGKETYYMWLNEKLQDIAVNKVNNDESMLTDVLDNIDEVSRNLDLGCYIKENKIKPSLMSADWEPEQKRIYTIFYQKLNKTASDYEKSYFTSYGFKNYIDTLPKIDGSLSRLVADFVFQAKDMFITYSKLHN